MSFELHQRLRFEILYPEAYLAYLLNEQKGIFIDPMWYLELYHWGLVQLQREDLVQDLPVHLMAFMIMHPVDNLSRETYTRLWSRKLKQLVDHA